MADWTDATDARGDSGHFGKAATFAKLLKATKFGDVETGILHLACLIEVDRNLGVAFGPGDRINGDRARHNVPLTCHHAGHGLKPNFHCFPRETSVEGIARAEAPW